MLNAERRLAEEQRLAEEEAKAAEEAARLAEEVRQAKIDALESTYDAAQDAVDTAQGALTQWQDAMARVGDLATSHFGPDLWGTDEGGSIWSEGGPASSDPIAALEESLAGLSVRQDLMDALAEAGITGSAFEELMSGSNEDIEALLASGDAAQFAELWALYEQQQEAIAAQAGEYAYGSDAAQAAADLAVAVAELTVVAEELTLLREGNEAVAANTARGADMGAQIVGAVHELKNAQVSAVARGAQAAMAARAAR